MNSWQKFKMAAKAVAVAGAVTFAGVAATYRDTRDYLIDGFIDAVRLKIRSGTTQSSNAVEIIRGSTLELAIPGSNTVAGLKANLGIAAGAIGVIMTASNVSFGQTFATAPVVTVTSGNETNGLYVSAVTTTNFTVNKTTTTSNYVRWIAIGAP